MLGKITVCLPWFCVLPYVSMMGHCQREDTGQVKCLVQPSMAFLRLSLTNVSVKNAAQMQACLSLHVASEMESWLCFFCVFVLI